MPSLMELVERVNKGELIDPQPLEVYQESPNSAERFLAHHARAMLDLRQAQNHMLQSLEAIEYSDQKVLNQFLSVSAFVGLTDTRSAAVIKFGACAIARREYALGIEALQNGAGTDLAHGGGYMNARDNCLFVATQYERASHAIGWNTEIPADWNNKQLKIAYVVSGISDDDTGRSVLSLATHVDARRFKLGIYSTEANVRREMQLFAHPNYALSSSKRGAATINSLNNLKVTSWIAPTDGDIATGAKELANQLVRDRIDVVVFDVTQADAIAAVAANWNVARVKINLVRRTPMYAAGIDCVVYLDQVRFEDEKEFWQARDVDARFVQEGVDITEALGTPPQRGAYGIPDNAVVLASAGADLEKTVSEEFVETIINILRAHPHAIYLLVGEGEMAWQKRKFDSAGVGKRVGYAGKRKDMPGFLRLADLYLAEFPATSGIGVLQAMRVECPVVAMHWGDALDQSQAATYAGNESTISGRDPNAYIERVSKLIREPAYRAKLGRTMKQRVEQYFGFNQTARHLEQVCDQLIQARGEAIADGEAFVQAA